MIVYYDFEDAQSADDVQVADLCVRGRVYRVLLNGRYSHDLQLDGRAASVVDGESCVSEIDLVDGYYDPDNADISDGVVEVKVQAALRCSSISATAMTLIRTTTTLELLLRTKSLHICSCKLHPCIVCR